MPVGRRGVGLMVVASACFALMSACVKALAVSLPTTEIVFVRCLLPLPWLVWLTRRRGAPLVARRPRLILARCVFGTVAMGLYFFCLGRMPLADVVVLLKTQPVFVALIAPFFLGERATWSVVVALAASMTGAILLVGPGLILGDVGGVWVLGSALASACAHTILRRLGDDDDPATVVLDFTVFVAVVSAMFGGADFVVPSLADVPALAGVAGFATLGQLFMTHAYRAGEAPGVAAAGYASVVFSALLGWLFWSETPSAAAWMGGGLVVAAGFLLARDLG